MPGTSETFQDPFSRRSERKVTSDTNLGRSIRELEHGSHINQRLAHLPVRTADEAQGDGQLEQKTVDEHKVSNRGLPGNCRPPRKPPAAGAWTRGEIFTGSNITISIDLLLLNRQRRASDQIHERGRRLGDRSVSSKPGDNSSSRQVAVTIDYSTLHTTVLTDVGRSEGHDAGEPDAKYGVLSKVEQAQGRLGLERRRLEPLQGVIVTRRLVVLVVEILYRLVVHQRVRYLKEGHRGGGFRRLSSLQRAADQDLMEVPTASSIYQGEDTPYRTRGVCRNGFLQAKNEPILHAVRPVLVGKRSRDSSSAIIHTERHREKHP